MEYLDCNQAADLGALWACAIYLRFSSVGTRTGWKSSRFAHILLALRLCGNLPPTASPILAYLDFGCEGTRASGGSIFLTRLPPRPSGCPLAPYSNDEMFSSFASLWTLLRVELIHFQESRQTKPTKRKKKRIARPPAGSISQPLRPSVHH